MELSPSARIAGYVRLSRQRADSLAADTQRKAIRDWASANGHDPATIAWYEDIDHSGGSLNRPAISQLRRDFARYDLAVAVKLDRWSRSVRDFSDLAEESQAAGCSLVAIRDSLDLSTPMGRFVANILASFAQMEREIIRDRILDGKATSRAEGRRQGGAPPFGYRKQRDASGGVLPGMIEPDPDQMSIWQEAAQKLIAGDSMRGVAQWLETVLPSKSGRGYSVSNLKRAITGELMTPILGETTRQKLLEVLAPKKRAEWSNATTLLSGILRCGNCGGKMGSGTTGNGAHRYRCSNFTTGRNCRNAAAIQAHLIEPFVTAAYLDAFGDVPQTYTEPVANHALEREAELKAEQQRLNLSLPSLDRQGKRDALDRMDAIDDELAGLAGLLRSTVYTIRETGLRMGEVWDQADTLRRRELLAEWLPQGLVITPANGRYRPPVERLGDPTQLTPSWADETTSEADVRAWLEGIWDQVKSPAPKRPGRPRRAHAPA